MQRSCAIVAVLLSILSCSSENTSSTPEGVGVYTGRWEGRFASTADNDVFGAFRLIVSPSTSDDAALRVSFEVDVESHAVSLPSLYTTIPTNAADALIDTCNDRGICVSIHLAGGRSAVTGTYRYRSSVFEDTGTFTGERVADLYLLNEDGTRRLPHDRADREPVLVPIADDGIALEEHIPLTLYSVGLPTALTFRIEPESPALSVQPEEARDVAPNTVRGADVVYAYDFVVRIAREGHEPLMNDVKVIIGPAGAGDAAVTYKLKLRCQPGDGVHLVPGDYYQMPTRPTEIVRDTVVLENGGECPIVVDAVRVDCAPEGVITLEDPAVGGVVEAGEALALDIAFDASATEAAEGTCTMIVHSQVGTMTLEIPWLFISESIQAALELNGVEDDGTLRFADADAIASERAETRTITIRNGGEDAIVFRIEGLVDSSGCFSMVLCGSNPPPCPQLPVEFYLSAGDERSIALTFDRPCGNGDTEEASLPLEYRGGETVVRLVGLQ